jgi:hypothetical protein
MSIHDRDWYRDWNKHEAEAHSRAQPEYRRVPHRLSPWTLFFCRAAIAVGMLIWFAVELRGWLRH